MTNDNVEIVFQTRLSNRVLLYCNTGHKDHSVPVIFVFWHLQVLSETRSLWHEGEARAILVFSPCTVWGKGCLATWTRGFVDLQVDQHRWWHWCASLYSCRRKQKWKSMILVHCYKQPTLQTGIKLANQLKVGFYQLGKTKAQSAKKSWRGI